MKKLILAVLMVAMVATPCMAELETASLFSLEGTYWVILGTNSYYYFSDGAVSMCGSGSSCTSSDTDPPCPPSGLCILGGGEYIDSPFFSMFSYGSSYGYLLTILGVGIAFSDSHELDLLIKSDYH